MPIDLLVPQNIVPSRPYNRCLIAGFDVQENNYVSGLPSPPVVNVYWLKIDQATGEVSDYGTYRASPEFLAIEKPDGTLSYRENVKRRLYKLLQDAGVFPPGTVT